jgi:hypothetical protein
MATINARSVSEFEALPCHPGEEFVFVLSGKVMLHSDAYEPLLLSERDSVYFNSRAATRLYQWAKRMHASFGLARIVTHSG